MSTSTLVRTKLAPPRVGPPLVRRPRLAARLDAHSGRAVLVSAPAGFGKTVLVAEWVAAGAGPVAWLSLDSLDDDPARFRRYLAEAVRGLGTEAAERSAELLAMLPPQDLTLTPDLADALASIGPEPVLVLDDLHEVSSPVALGLVEALLHLTPPAFRMVALSRTDPPLALGGLRSQGELLELRERDLRFTEGEARELFDLMLPGVLDASQVHRLEERTEGWPAGLRLAGLALHEASDPAGFVESFSGTHRFVTDYLLEEALERRSPELQQFLLDTSVLRRFRAETCAAITGEPDAADRLAEVEAANLFLVPLGGEGGWYRYHHLFADLLRYRLARLHPGRGEELHRRASRWFEDAGDVALALEHASLMEDRTRLLELLDAHAMNMLSRSELGALKHWLAYVPDPVPGAYPMLFCVLAWVRVVTERAPNVEGLLNAVVVALESAPADYDPARRRKASVELDILTAYAARHGGRLEEAVRVSERVLRTVAEDDAFSRGLVAFNLARARQMLAEPAGELLGRSFEDSLRAGNLFVALSALGHQAAAVAQTDGVHRAREALAAATAFAEGQHLTRYPAYATVLYHRGLVELLAGETDAAAAHFEEAVTLGAGNRLPEAHVNGLVGLARVAMERWRFDEAEAILVEVSALGRGANLVLIDTTLSLEHARLALDRETAWAGPPVPPIVDDREREPGRWTAVRETETVLALWQAVRSGRHDVARRLSYDVVREAESRLRRPAACAALVARALVHDAPEQGRLMDQALGLAASHGYVRPFLDAPAQVRDALRGALARETEPAARAFAHAVLHRLGPEPKPMGESAASPAAARHAVLLTEREVEVLAALFRGESNRAAARSLFVSVDTVKTHLKHIYAKLGVTNASEAVVRARELGFGPPDPVQ